MGKRPNNELQGLTPEQLRSMKIATLHPEAESYGDWLARQPVAPTRAPEPAVPPPALQTMQSDPFRVYGGTDPYALPPDWSHLINPELGNVEGNYNPLGPNGQELANGAIGWTPRGMPYYGSGVGGYIRGVIGRITAPVREPLSLTSPGIRERIVPDPNADPATGGTRILSAASALAEVATSRAGNFGGTTQGVRGLLFAPAQLAGRGASEFIRGLMALLQQPSEATEQAAGLLLGLEEISSTSPIPNAQEMNLFTRAIYAIPVVHPLYDAARVITSGRSIAEVRQIAGDSIEAGRIAYSTMADPSIRAELIRRVRAGEDGQMVAMELEIPWAEFAGLIVLDPLNFLGPGIGRAAQADRRMASVTDEFMRFADEGVRGAVDNLANAGDDVARAEALTSLGEAQRTSIAATRTGLARHSAELGVQSLTATGKRAILGRRSGELFNWVARVAGNPDDTLEVMRGLAMAASDDVNEVQAGLAILNRFPVPRPLYSRAGNELAIVLRDVLSDGGRFAPEQFLDELGDTRTLEDVVAMARRRMDPVVARMFPTITEAVAAGREVSPFIRGLARFDRVAQHALYRPVNTFFAGLYMGLSPGYAFRNVMTNTFHVLVDYGPSAAGRALRAGFGEALAPIRQRLFGPGAFVDRSYARVSRWLGGQIPEGMGRGLVGAAAGAEQALPASRMGVFGTFLRASERGERGAAAAVIDHVVNQTMRRMLVPGRALPEIAPLVNAGMDVASAQYLARLVVDNYGDVNASVTAFIEAARVGNAEAWRTIGQFAREDQAALDAFGLTDEVTRALQAGSYEGFASQLDEIEAAIRAEAGEVAGEVTGIAEDAPHLESAVGLGEARSAGYISNESMAGTQAAFEANSSAVRAYRRAVDELRDRAFYAAGQTGVPNAALDPLVRRFSDNADALTEGTVAAARQANDSGWQWTRRIQRMDAQSDWAAIWRQIGIEGEPPAGLVRQQLLDTLWEVHTHPRVRLVWQNWRDSHTVLSENFARDISNLSGTTPDTHLLAQARDAARQAQLWDNSAYVEGRYVSLQAMTEAAPIEPEVAERLEQVAAPPRREPGGAVMSPEAQAIDTHRQGAANAVTEGRITREELRMSQAAGRPPSGTDPGEAIFASRAPNGRGALTEWLDEQRRLGATQFSTNYQTANRVRVPGEEIPVREGSAFIRWGYEDMPGGGRIPVLTGIQGRGGGQGGQGFFRRMVDEGLIENAGIYRTALGEERRLYRIPAAGEPRRLIPPLTPGATPSLSRALHENMGGIEELFDRLKRQAQENWGRLQQITFGPEQSAALQAWRAEGVRRVSEARLVAGQTANAARDFTLLNYQGKTYFDLALGYVFPYHFWYTRTYAHWLQRVASAPEVIAAYAKYRHLLEDIHAGAPEWWRYQINSNELLGTDSENPLFFNLEATLSPVNGLTGVDFNDPYRRVNWWTALLDDIGKFGPSTWTPFSIATALALYASGENDAAARWGGRLVPQTATFRAVTSLLGVNQGQGIELDPSVNFFSGGSDPYERRRIGRGLGGMMADGTVDEASAIDAGNQQSGPIWEAARGRATRQWAPGQLASFFLGVGFRARPQSDMAIDQFYQDYYRLMAMEPNLSPEEYRRSFDTLREAYPFMDTVLISRRGGTDRDRAYAYNVLARLPPAQSDDYAEWAGIDEALLSRFYDDKGHIENWTEGDRMRFMGAILNLGAALDVPSDGTRAEWTDARNRYSAMLRRAENRFGDDIWSRVDSYLALPQESAQERDAARRVLDRDPQLSQAMDFRANEILRDPNLALYYGGIWQIESYYRNQMYAAAERQWPNIWNTWDQYYDAENRSDFWDQHPELAAYNQMRDGWDETIAQAMVDFSERFPDRPTPELRPGAPEELPLTTSQGLPSLSQKDWEELLGPNLSGLVNDWIDGEELPSTARRRLQEVADELGLPSIEVLRELIERAPFVQ